MEFDGPVAYDPGLHDVSSFDCGSEAQTRWLRQIARTAQAAGTARVYVVTLAGQRQVAYPVHDVTTRHEGPCSPKRPCERLP